MNTEISGSLELLGLQERGFLQKGRFALKSFAKQEGSFSHSAGRSGRFKAELEGRGVETETFRGAGASRHCSGEPGQEHGMAR